MNAKIVLIVFLVLISVLSKGQDNKLLKQYVYNQFKIEPSLQLGYGNLKQPKISPEPDELSYESLNELKDSFETTNDVSYLMRIYYVYDGLNEIDSAKHYLREMAIRTQQILDNTPDNIEFIRNISIVYYLLGDMYSSIEYTDKVLDFNPKDTFALVANALNHIVIGDFSIALKYSERGIEAYPESPGFYLLKTSILITSELFTQLKKDSWEGFNSDFTYLQRTEEAYKNNLELQFWILYCKLFVQFSKILAPCMINPPESMKNFKFQLSKNDSLTLNDYEIRFLKMSELERFKNYYATYFYIGFIKLLQGEYNKAIDYFIQSIETFGNDKIKKDDILDSYNNIITCCHYMADSIRAKKWVKRKINRKVSYKSLPEDYIEMATYYLIGRRFKKGEKLLRKSLKLDSTKHKAYIKLANIKIINGNYKEAEVLLDKCFRISPNCIEMYESAILLSLFQEDLETARFYLNKLIVYDPESTFVQDIKRDFIKE